MRCNSTREVAILRPSAALVKADPGERPSPASQLDVGEEHERAEEESRRRSPRRWRSLSGYSSDGAAPPSAKSSPPVLVARLVLRLAAVVRLVRHRHPNNAKSKRLTHLSWPWFEHA